MTDPKPELADSSPSAVDPMDDRLRRLEALVAGLETTRAPAPLALPPGVLLDGATPPPPPNGAVLRPPDLIDAVSRGWWLFQLVAEVRLALRMYFDPRYRVSRATQFGLPLVVGLAVLNYVLFNWLFAIPLLGGVLERLGLVVLAVVGYRLVVHELARYRSVLDYLTKYGFR